MSDECFLLRLGAVAVTVGLLLTLVGAWPLTFWRFGAVIVGLLFAATGLWLGAASDFVRRHPVKSTDDR